MSYIVALAYRILQSMIVSYKQLLRFLFPPTADERLVLHANPALFAQATPFMHQGHLALLSYREPVVRAAIHVAKFHHNEQALQLLATALHHYTQTHHVDLIIPIPLGAARYRSRGYNQVVEIIKTAQTMDPHLRYNDRCLLRNRNTKPQSELSRVDRLQNLKGAFTLNRKYVPEHIETLHILLLDDVHTSGTTLQTAKQTLASLRPASITTLALAH